MSGTKQSTKGRNKAPSLRGGRVGGRIIDGLTELRDVLRRGEPLSERFKVRNVRRRTLNASTRPDALGLLADGSTIITQSVQEGIRKP